MSRINELQKQIIDEFNILDNWTEKYEYLIELGKSLPLIESEKKIDSNLIKGCQSRVWLNAKIKDRVVVFTADSDAIITKGIIALLIRVLSHQPAKDIANADLSFIEKIGLNSHLSITRANGLLSMIKQMKIYALTL